jgi:hypothetical protein
MKPVKYADFKRIQKMSLNDFNRWMHGICKDMYVQGLNYGAVWTEDDLFRLLRSEGIGAERANRIIDKMLEVNE